MKYVTRKRTKFVSSKAKRHHAKNHYVSMLIILQFRPISSIFRQMCDLLRRMKDRRLRLFASGTTVLSCKHRAGSTLQSIFIRSGRGFF